MWLEYLGKIINHVQSFSVFIVFTLVLFIWITVTENCTLVSARAETNVQFSEYCIFKFRTVDGPMKFKLFPFLLIWRCAFTLNVNRVRGIISILNGQRSQQDMWVILLFYGFRFISSPEATFMVDFCLFLELDCSIIKQQQQQLGWGSGSLANSSPVKKQKR